jgi:predicted aspartyl protease
MVHGHEFRMGIVHVEATVSSGSQEAVVRLLVDSGATYTALKEDVWRKLGLAPKRQIELVLADGTTITRPLSEASMAIADFGEYHTPVLLGESGDENLLGTVTLEIFGLVLDPLRRELRPMRSLLK